MPKVMVAKCARARMHTTDATNVGIGPTPGAPAHAVVLAVYKSLVVPKLCDAHSLGLCFSFLPTQY
jgi:hypothetical protein